MKIDRLVSIIMILLEKKRISAQKLADMFEVSRRTIYRDLEAISMAGIPVSATPGPSGGIEIMSQYKIDKKVFSRDDLSALLLGLNSLPKTLRSSEVEHTLAKLKSLVPEDQAEDIEIRTSHVLIDLSPWFGERNVNHNLEIIKAALEESRLISFTYIDGHSTKSERKAEVYQLVLKGRDWYVQTFCLTKNDFRLFRLSRMAELTLLDEKFLPRKYQKPVLDFEETAKKLQTFIKLRVHKSILDRLLEFCDFDCIKADGAEYYLAEYPFIERDYYYDMLLSFGDKCECMEPPHVREELKKRIERLGRVYGIRKSRTC
ncbi:YafY family transcriptional regulator [Treponema ruminis]|uniref:Putative DNA-binding transcriptional regulator YafY n=1 Tax=Treponema ruminis TaxID=744515 RepID=A0A7W8GA50_9SPIR|nr:YafY family protein [Treponema ruminis]MBB5226674.1 putative DNA-binding transcriptional regulator YafY [Treponema ruminis]QSI02098.1 YafY family transcriptional regulator [Treponema ruminis]